MFCEDIYLEIAKYLNCNQLIPLCLTCKFLFNNNKIWKGKLEKEWNTSSNNPLMKAIELKNNFEHNDIEIYKQEGYNVRNMKLLGGGIYIYVDKYSIYRWDSNKENDALRILFTSEHPFEVDIGKYISIRVYCREIIVMTFFGEIIYRENNELTNLFAYIMNNKKFPEKIKKEILDYKDSNHEYFDHYQLNHNFMKRKIYVGKCSIHVNKNNDIFIKGRKVYSMNDYVKAIMYDESKIVTLGNKITIFKFTKKKKSYKYLFIFIFCIYCIYSTLLISNFLSNFKSSPYPAIHEHKKLLLNLIHETSFSCDSPRFMNSSL